jgi:hypothetical protein
MSLSDKFLLGCDPEWFLQSSNTMQPVSAIDKFRGTKEEPFQLDEGVSVQVDNCAVEYGIKPASCMEDWVERNVSAGYQLQSIASAMGLYLLKVPSVVFPEEELQDQRAWVFGCDPDLNAWTKEWNPRPEARNPFLRSAGGHLHFGFPHFEPELMFDVAKGADLFIALPGLLVDTDDRRRELYGKAGAMRMKVYGMEWRTASNFWTTTQKRMEWVYRVANRMLTEVRKGIIVPECVREIIDTGDRVGARSVIEAYGLEVCP